MKSPITIDENHLEPIHFSGLNGRLLHVPPKEKSTTQKIVLIYGQHASLERMYTIALFMSRYGEVYCPDLPGFGGMDSFYEVDRKPTADNYADYLFTFLKTHKLTKDVTIIAMSHGGQFTTRMLQRHPESQKWFKHVIGFVSFSGKEQFKLSKIKRIGIMSLAWTMRSLIGSFLYQSILFSPPGTLVWVNLEKPLKKKMQHADPTMRSNMVAMERRLWHINDTRTRGATVWDLFTTDISQGYDTKIPMTFINIIADQDHFFDNRKVKKGFLRVYKDYDEIEMKLHVHAPSIIGSEEEVAEIFPDRIKEILAKSK